MTGRREEAVSAFEKAIQIAPNNFLAHIGLAATYSAMGREKEARVEADEVPRISPKFSVDSFARIITNKNQSQVDELVNAFRKDGLK
jgi:tetratricopeptide (TPR) repeat protein